MPHRGGPVLIGCVLCAALVAIAYVATRHDETPPRLRERADAPSSPELRPPPERPSGDEPTVPSDLRPRRGGPPSIAVDRRWPLRVVYEGTRIGVSGARVEGPDGTELALTDASGRCSIPSPIGTPFRIVDAWAERLGVAARFAVLETAVSNGARTGEEDSVVSVVTAGALARFEGVVVDASGKGISDAWIHAVAHVGATERATEYKASTQADHDGRFSLAYAPLPRHASGLRFMTWIGAAGYEPRRVSLADSSGHRIVLDGDPRRVILSLALPEGTRDRAGAVLVEETTDDATDSDESTSYVPDWVRLTQAAAGVRQLPSPRGLRLDGDGFVAGYEVRDVQSFLLDVASTARVRIRFMNESQLFLAEWRPGSGSAAETIPLRPTGSCMLRGKLVGDRSALDQDVAAALDDASVYPRGWRTVYEAPLASPHGFTFPVLGTEAVELVILGPGMLPVIARTRPTGEKRLIELPSLRPLRLEYEYTPLR